MPPAAVEARPAVASWRLAAGAKWLGVA